MFQSLWNMFRIHLKERTYLKFYSVMECVRLRVNFDPWVPITVVLVHTLHVMVTSTPDFYLYCAFCCHLAPSVFIEAVPLCLVCYHCLDRWLPFFCDGVNMLYSVQYTIFLVRFRPHLQHFCMRQMQEDSCNCSFSAYFGNEACIYCCNYHHSFID